MWQYVQLGQWQQLIARCANVERLLLKLGVTGEEAAKPAPDADPAEPDAAKLAEVAEIYRRALGVARLVGSAEPNLFIAVVSGLDMMEDAYAGLLRVALATGSNEAQRWDGEMGVLAIGRQHLYAALQRYEKQRDEDPPASIDELLQFEAELLRQTILGIGLRPAELQPQAGTGEKQASPS
jgi:hypothetical protein